MCSARKRCFDVPKIKIIDKSLDSIRVNLENSINRVNVDVTVVEDLCSEKTIDKINGTFSGFETRIFSLGLGSNAKSFCSCVKLAQEFKDEDIVFFCEDDYLFLIDDIFQRMSYSMMNISNKVGEYVGLMPDDYPDRYINGISKNKDVVSLETGHFMSIDKTTCTFSAFCRDVKRYSSQLYNFINWPYVGEDQSINLMWQKVKLFCPIPAWTMHSQLKSIIPPYIDFQKVDNYFKECS